VLGAQLILGVLFGLLGLVLADPIVAMLKIALQRQAESNAGGEKPVGDGTDNTQSGTA
jgi:predicted PurR-regulated permease PerM